MPAAWALKRLFVGNSLSPIIYHSYMQNNVTSHFQTKTRKIFCSVNAEFYVIAAAHMNLTTPIRKP